MNVLFDKIIKNMNSMYCKVIKGIRFPVLKDFYIPVRENLIWSVGQILVSFPYNAQLQYCSSILGNSFPPLSEVLCVK